MGKVERIGQDVEETVMCPNCSVFCSERSTRAVAVLYTHVNHGSDGHGFSFYEKVIMVPVL